MPVKNIVIPLETEYLQEEAKARGVSRTYLARVVMETVISQKMVPSIIGEKRIVAQRAAPYRRFRPTERDSSKTGAGPDKRRCQ